MAGAKNTMATHTKNIVTHQPHKNPPAINIVETKNAGEKKEQQFKKPPDIHFFKMHVWQKPNTRVYFFDFLIQASINDKNSG